MGTEAGGSANAEAPRDERRVSLAAASSGGAAPMTPAVWAGLIAIIAIALGMRVYRLGDIPAGLFCDEAAVGYNAWSLLHDGHDEHGRPWPLFIWSFYAFKYPIDIYPSTLWVWLFGLTEAATRMQSALYGTGNVLVAFLLGRQLFGSTAGLAAAVAVAVLPWQFHFSRIAYSLTGFSFFFGFAVYYLARALGAQARRRDWLLAAVMFGLCLYAYAVAQVMIPVFLAAVLIFSFPVFWRRRIWVLQAGLVGALVAAPFVYFYSQHLERAGVYFQQVSLLAKPIPLQEKIDLVLRQNWPVYFDRPFLLERGDPILRHGVRTNGVLYPALVPWIALGILGCLFRRDRASKLILLWLVLYPLGAALTRETPSATRAFLGSLVFPLLAGIGFERAVAIACRLPWQWLRAVAVAGVGAAAALPLGPQVYRYLQHYFVEYPRYSAVGIEGFQYGYRELFRLMEERRHRIDDFILSSSSVNNPYIFRLFYVPRPPLRRSEWGNAETEYREPRPIALDTWYKPDRRILLAALPMDMPLFDSWDDRVDIVGPGGDTAFILLENPRPKQFIDRWELFGPFDNPNNSRRNIALVDPLNMESLVPVLGGPGMWEEYPAPHGMVEMNRGLADRVPGANNNPEFVIAYLRTAVDSPDDRIAQLELIGSRDAVYVWLNGKQIGADPLFLDEMEIASVPLQLRAGGNVVMIKSIETVGDWWLIGNLVGKDGTPDPELSIVPVGDTANSET